MIGTELLQLLQGDPLAQMRQQMAGPNPNPQAPPPPMPLVNRADDATCALISAWNWTRSTPMAADAGDCRRAYPQHDSRPRAPGSPASARRGPAAAKPPAAVWTARPWPPRARQTWFNCTVA